MGGGVGQIVFDLIVSRVHPIHPDRNSGRWSIRDFSLREGAARIMNNFCFYFIQGHFPPLQAYPHLGQVCSMSISSPYSLNSAGDSVSSSASSSPA